ncbi:MAG: Lrp/AsnC family transcriptional regulator [Chloroflexi bacterium]|nr:Lrp/AsnC family transcriptional regulator [Chloroflexota bacterium]
MADVADDIDRRIVELLRANGRRSNRELARALGIAEATVRRRVKRLIDGGVMEVVAVTNPNRIGFTKSVIVGLHVETACLREIAARLAELDEVRYLSIVAGTHDIIFAAQFRSDQSLAQFLIDKLAAMPGIRRVQTSYALKQVKHTYDWLPIRPAVGS